MSAQLVLGSLDGAVRAVTQLALVLAIGLMMAWDRRRRGTYPSGRPPRDFNRAIFRTVLGAVAVAGLAWLAGEQVNVGGRCHRGRRRPRRRLVVRA